MTAAYVSHCKFTKTSVGDSFKNNSFPGVPKEKRLLDFSQNPK